MADLCPGRHLGRTGAGAGGMVSPGGGGPSAGAVDVGAGFLLQDSGDRQFCLGVWFSRGGAVVAHGTASVDLAGVGLVD